MQRHSARSRVNPGEGILSTLSFLSARLLLRSRVLPFPRALLPALAFWWQTRGTGAQFPCSGLHRLPQDALRPSELGSFGTSPPFRRDLSLRLPIATPLLCSSPPT